MRGRIFKYGRGGDPLIRDAHGRVVVLCGYEKNQKPKIGSDVEYKLTGKSGNVYFARMLGQGAGAAGEPCVEEELLSALEEIIGIIDVLDRDYERYLKNEGILLEY